MAIRQLPSHCPCRSSYPYLWVGQHFAVAGVLRRLTLRDPTARAPNPVRRRPAAEHVEATSFSDTGACSAHAEGRHEPIEAPGRP